jgi:hypothetical protein
VATRNLKDHAIAASLNRLQELLSDKSLQDPKLVSDEVASFNREKLINVARSLRTLFNQSSASTVSETALNQMNSNLQQPIAELTAFISNRNVGHLANAVAHIDQNVLSYTWAFYPKSIPSNKAEVADLFEQIRERSRETIGILDEQKSELSREIADLGEMVRAQEAKLSEVQDASARTKAEISAALASLQTTFEKDQTLRNSDYAEFLQQVKAEFVDTKADFTKSAQSVLSALQAHRDDAARIVQVVGDIGVTGNYQTIANKETKQANLWRLVTVGLFSCGLVMAGLTFYRFYHEPVTAENTLAIAVRLLYALAIAAPAFYTARESARHRTNADRARQTELELASLGPFIELMEDADKDEIRKSLISKYFGRSVDPHEVRTIFDSDKQK